MTARLGRPPSSLDGRAEEVSMTQLLHRVAASDRMAFVSLYDTMSSRVRGQAQRCLLVMPWTRW